MPAGNKFRGPLPGLPEETGVNPPILFDWNRPDANGRYAGTARIQRDQLATYFQQQLSDYVSSNCFAPQVRVRLSGFMDHNIHFDWSLTPHQTPAWTKPSSGSTLLEFTYSECSGDRAGERGRMALTPAFQLTVDCSGNTIVVTQRLSVHLMAQIKRSGTNGNIIDLTIIDIYTLSIDASGALRSTLSSSRIDHSENPRTGPLRNFFTDLNSLIKDISKWVRGFAPTHFSEIPASLVESLAFPAADSFIYGDLRFSDQQDLVGHLAGDRPPPSSTPGKHMQ